MSQRQKLPYKNPLTESISDYLTNPDVLKRIELLAKEVMPVVSIASHIQVPVSDFYYALRTNQLVQKAILKGESEAFKDQYRKYEAFIYHFETGSPLKTQDGKTINKQITAFQAQARTNAWREFRKNFEKNSYTYSINKRLKDSVENEEDTVMTKSNDAIMFRNKMLRYLDKMTGVTQHRPDGDLSWRPEHYKYTKIKRQRQKELADKKSKEKENENNALGRPHKKTK